jgi:hypothetical protein
MHDAAVWPQSPPHSQVTAGADELALSGQGEASRNATMDAIARAPLLESVRPPAARCGWMARVVLAAR